MSVTRIIVPFPGRNLIDTGEAVVCAIPGRPETGGAGFAPDDAATYQPTPNESIASQRWEQSLQRIALNLNGRRVRAISIAPDSPIAECDIALGGNPGEVTRHRLSPGNPCLAVGEFDYAQVTIPDSIPGFDGEDGEAIYWDAIRDISTGEVIVNYNQVVGWPLRLELWQDDILPMRSHRRAAHVAHAVMAFPAAVGTRSLYVCVNGRRKVSVIADLIDTGNSSSATLRCLAIGGQKDTANKNTEDIQTHAIALPLNPAGDTTLTIDTTTRARIIEMDALARPILQIEITGVPGEAATDVEVQVHVRAED